MTETAIEVEMKMKEAWLRLCKFAETVKPQYILVGRIQGAMLEAHVKFAGRDRRRIKREVNKAIRKVKAIT